jgi:hypothetical protein
MIKLKSKINIRTKLKFLKYKGLKVEFWKMYREPDISVPVQPLCRSNVNFEMNSFENYTKLDVF